jgi:hypothetical protein
MKHDRSQKAAKKHKIFCGDDNKQTAHMHRSNRKFMVLRRSLNLFVLCDIIYDAICLPMALTLKSTHPHIHLISRLPPNTQNKKNY